MAPVEKAIRNAVREGDELSTPSQSQPFRVGKISSEGIVLELGQERTPTFFQWQCLEGVPAFLQQHGRVRINGSGKSQVVVRGTLDGFLKEHVNRLTAGWVAALLEKAGVVEIERTRPAYVKATDAR
jgi:hypothetical protein